MYVRMSSSTFKYCFKVLQLLFSKKHFENLKHLGTVLYIVCNVYYVLQGRSQVFIGGGGASWGQYKLIKRKFFCGI